MPGAVVRFIDRDMASRIFGRPSVDQNVALLRLSVLNSCPAGGELIPRIILAIAARRRLAEVRVVSFDQRHTLAAADGLSVQV